NSLTMPLSSLRVTAGSDAIAVPMLCTSLGCRCFKTDDATSSPSVISSTAARAVPFIARAGASLAIFVNPFPNDLRDEARILHGQRARALKVRIVRLGDQHSVLAAGRGGSGRQCAGAGAGERGSR